MVKDVVLLAAEDLCDKLLKPYDPEREQNSYIGTAGSPLMRNFSAGINLNF